METNSSKGKPINVNDLAVERNRLAAERTLMAWIRTALSMITFGFTIYKFMQVMQNQSTSFVVRNAHAPRTVGLTLISIGTFALLIACIQHYRYIKNLTPGQPYKFLRDLSFLVACLLGLLGLLMFGSIAFNTGPFQ
jgi:putative membrane protein